MKHPRHTRSAPITVGFVSLGCAKNLVDTQTMAGELLAAGIEFARCPEEADVVVVNTCSFIEAARQEAYASIAEVCELKRRGVCRGILVTGCLPQRYGKAVLDRFPDVDGVMGVDELAQIPQRVKAIIAGDHERVVDVSLQPTRLFDSRGKAPVFTGGPFAYLKIAEGCNHHCAFCAIPGIRGRYRSRTVTSVVQEAEALLQRGIRELNLVSQDTTGYGRDRKDGTNLPGLIRQLGRLGGTFWIRLLYGYPTGVTDALLDAMAEIPQVCHYFDVPIQHSHPEVLASMKRGGTVTSLGNMAARIRRAMPDAAIRTTCLVGFPGETEEHVRHLEEFLRCAAFDHVGVFVYSPEEGTPAFSLGPGVDADEAEARRTRLLEVQRAVVDRKLVARIGTTGEVLLENPLDGGEQCWAARNRSQAPEVDGCVRVSGIKARKPAGQIVTVRYTVAAGYDLHAVGQ